MILIRGLAGSGKSFILADKAIKSSTESKRVIIYSDNPRDIFQKLGFVLGKNTIRNISVIKVENTSEIIKDLTLNRGKYDEIFIDLPRLTQIDLVKLDGFSKGADIQIYATIQLDNIRPATKQGVYLTLFENVSALDDIEVYSPERMNLWITRWTKSN